MVFPGLDVLWVYILEHVLIAFHQASYINDLSILSIASYLMLYWIYVQLPSTRSFSSCSTLQFPCNAYLLELKASILSYCSRQLGIHKKTSVPSTYYFRENTHFYFKLSINELWVRIYWELEYKALSLYTFVVKCAGNFLLFVHPSFPLISLSRCNSFQTSRAPGISWCTT
jgi:hypothetical protein